VGLKRSVTHRTRSRAAAFRRKDGPTPGIGRAAARRSLQQVYAPVATPRHFIRLMQWVTLRFRPTYSS
jgi:hypothetical protein